MFSARQVIINLFVLLLGVIFGAIFFHSNSPLTGAVIPKGRGSTSQLNSVPADFSPATSSKKEVSNSKIDAEAFVNLPVSLVSKLPNTVCFKKDLALTDKIADLLKLSENQRSEINDLNLQVAGELSVIQGNHARIIPHTDAPGATIIIPPLPEGQKVFERFREKLRTIIPEQSAAFLEAISKNEMREQNGNFGKEPIVIEVKSLGSASGYQVTTSYGLKDGINIPISKDGHVDGIESEGGKTFSFQQIPNRLAPFLEMEHR